MDKIRIDKNRRRRTRWAIREPLDTAPRSSGPGSKREATANVLRASAAVFHAPDI